jgi:hypothetical protein
VKSGFQRLILPHSIPGAMLQARIEMRRWRNSFFKAPYGLADHCFLALKARGQFSREFFATAGSNRGASL